MFGRLVLLGVALGCFIARFLIRQPLLGTALEVTAGIAAFSLWYLKKSHLLYAFSFVLAIVGVALFEYGQHLLVIFAGWEAVSLAGWILIAFGRGLSGRSLHAAWIAFLTNRVGDVFWLAGIFSEGQFLAGLWIGALVKAGVFPFTFWLVQAMFAPVSVSALLHSAVIVGLGAYLPLKLPVLSGLPLPEWGMTLLWGASTFAGIGAVLSRSAKAILAWTTAAHLSLVLLLSGDPESARTSLFHHSYLKAALFLLLGLAQKNGGFSLTLTIAWVGATFLLTMVKPFSNPFLTIPEGLTALALGRAWRRTGTEGHHTLHSLLLMIFPAVLIGRAVILNAEHLHLSWEQILLAVSFSVGMAYSGPFTIRLDRFSEYAGAFLLHGWLRLSRFFVRVDEGLQGILDALARVAMRLGVASAHSESWVARTGWQALARYIRQGFGLLGGEDNHFSYGQALGWGFLLTLLTNMLWKVWR